MNIKCCECGKEIFIEKGVDIVHCEKGFPCKDCENKVILRTISKNLIKISENISKAKEEDAPKIEKIYSEFIDRLTNI